VSVAVPCVFAATNCDVSAKVPEGARTFAKTNDRSRWREFRTIQNVPELDPGAGVSAQFWWNDRATLAYLVEPGEDFGVYTRYCFNSEGQLEGIGFEVRTAWGWGYRLEGTMIRGRLHADHSEFFNTENDKRIPKPEGANDISETLNPTLYLTTSKLPFANLIARPSGNGSESTTQQRQPN
jgi:hypothetical protein